MVFLHQIQCDSGGAKTARRRHLARDQCHSAGNRHTPFDLDQTRVRPIVLRRIGNPPDLLIVDPHQ
jgi:hypothetical protein